MVNQLVRTPVRAENRPFCFKLTDQQTVWLRPWWTIKQPLTFQVKTRFHEGWRRHSRPEWAVEDNEGEIVNCARTIHYHNSEVDDSITVEVPCRCVWAITAVPIRVLSKGGGMRVSEPVKG